MGKLLRNTMLRSVGRAIVSLLLFFCFSQGVWATAYTIYFLRPSGEGRWGNTPRVHIYYNDAQGDHVIVDGGTSDGDMTNVAAELYSKTFETDKSSISLIFNNGGWGSNSDTKSNLYGPWTPESGIYFTTSNNYQQAVTTYNVRQFSSGEFIYLKNYSPSCISDNWICSLAQYAYLYMWGGTAGVHTYRFNFVSGYGEEYATDAKYGAEIETAGTYAYLIITRGNVSCTDGSFPEKYNQTGNIAIDPTKNYISSYECSSSSVTWDVFNPCTAPDVTTASAPAEKSHSTARLTGSYTTENVCVPISKGVAYKTEGGSYTYETDGTSSAGSILVNLSGLSPLTTYYYKVYVELTGGNKEYGDEYSFTTDCNGGIDITTDPEGVQTVCLGSAAALSVEATGASNLTYQWYYSSTNESKAGATAVPGATSATYTPAMVGAFYYYCAVGAAGGYCEKESKYSGLVTIKGVPVLSASTSSTTNYAPVKISAAGAENITWSITSGTGGYLYKTSDTQAMFKGNVGEGSATTYTIQGAANGCNGTTTVTVNRNADNCQ